MTPHRYAGWFVCGMLLMMGGSAAVADGNSASSIDTFLSRHWQRPLPYQGETPPGFSPLEASLDPRACGTCHPRQLQDWQGSLHARAMGPGMLGQLREMEPNDRAGHQACLRCHAPLAEQADELTAWIADDKTVSDPPTENAEASPLSHQGLICAACHLRDWVIHGPPPRDDGGGILEGAHDGFQTSTAFEDSRFCAACHQFEPDGFALNGKLLENTFEEWRASPQAAAGQSCQSCHMPDRRHLWRGIHDKATVLSGVEITLDRMAISGASITARLTLSNSGVGHHFPTYVTPRVLLEAVQLDHADTPIPHTRQERIIARQVSLNLSEELFDTRLAPGESSSLDYRLPRDGRAGTLRLRIQVEPDLFYRDFYRAVLSSGAEGKGAGMLRRALRAAETSAYTLYQREIPLP